MPFTLLPMTYSCENFEDEFEISIPDDDAEKIQTVGDAVGYIKDKTAAAS